MYSMPSKSWSEMGTVMGSRTTSLGKRRKTNQQTIENFTSFALKFQNKPCTETEKIVEHKLSGEQMPTIHHSRDKKCCQKASMTDRRAGRLL